MVERPTFHFSAAAFSVIPPSQSSKIRFRISVGIAFILDLYHCSTQSNQSKPKKTRQQQG
jgi:hypothetical protein